MCRRFALSTCLLLLTFQDVGAQSFALQFDAPESILAVPNSLVSIDVVGQLLTTGLDDSDQGASGWSIGWTSTGATIVDPTTVGTLAADDFNGGLRNAGFEVTELATSNDDPSIEGAVSSVVLSFTMPTTLPPQGASDIVRFTLEGVAPSAGSTETWTASFVDGMQGRGQPVDNRVSWSNATFTPTLGQIEIDVTGASEEPDILFFEWRESENGRFDDADNWINTNWITPPPPGINDVASFAKPGDYQVTLPPSEQAAATRFLLVSDGNVDFVTPNKQPFVLTADARIIGGTLRLDTSVSLDIRDDLIVHSGSNLIAESGSSMSVVDEVLIGFSEDSGSGSVYVDEGSLLSAARSEVKIGGFGFEGSLDVSSRSTAILSTEDEAVRVGDSNRDSSVGKLNVTDGSSIEIGNLLVATRDSAARGSMLVNRSTVQQTRRGAVVVIGGDGDGDAELLLQDGSSFTTDQAGRTIVNSTGRIEIQNSSFVSEGPMTMREGSSVTLNGGSLLANQGLDNSADGLLNFRGGELKVTGGDFIPTSTGRFHLDSASSQSRSILTIGNGAEAAIGDILIVGIDGSGVLSIIDGGEVTALRGVLATRPGASGSISVSGANSQLQLDELTVGGNSASAGGVGSLSVRDGGSARIDRDLLVWRNGTIRLDEGELRVNAANVTGDGSINFVSGTLQLIGDEGYTLSDRDGPLERALGGMDVTLADQQRLVVDEQLTLPTGTSITTVSSEIKAATIANNGVLSLNKAVVSTDSGIGNEGDLVLIDATVLGPLSNEANSSVVVVGEVDFNGFVSGPGSFFGPGQANFNAGISPGASPAELTFEGDIRLGSNNVSTIELGGRSAGVEHDYLNVTGSATMGGTLEIELIGDYRALVGDTFEILTAGQGIQGTFDQAIVPELDDFMRWAILYRSDAVELAVMPQLPGDFDANGQLNVEDIDRLSLAVRAGEPNFVFDLNRNGSVDAIDRDIWVHEIVGTYYGDADLNGEFNDLDIVHVFVVGEYADELDGNSTWATGDWNGDGDFDDNDIVVAFIDGGYNQGPRLPAQPVPEPGTLPGHSLSAFWLIDDIDVWCPHAEPHDVLITARKGKHQVFRSAETLLVETPTVRGQTLDDSV